MAPAVTEGCRWQNSGSKPKQRGGTQFFCINLLLGSALEIVLVPGNVLFWPNVAADFYHILYPYKIKKHAFLYKAFLLNVIRELFLPELG